METRTVEVPVPVTVKVPENLTKRCVIERREVGTYGEGTDVGLEALAALDACDERMQRIRNLPTDE